MGEISAPAIIARRRVVVYSFWSVNPMNYQIITDSCCDFTQQQYRDWDVACAPLSVLYEGESKPVTLVPGEFIIFFPPLDAHAPCCRAPNGPARIKKVVVKILAD